MVVMRLGVVLAGRMRIHVARGADLVAFIFQLRRMRVMAVRAADTLLMHLALQERTVDVHLI